MKEEENLRPSATSLPVEELLVMLWVMASPCIMGNEHDWSINNSEPDNLVQTAESLAPVRLHNNDVPALARQIESLDFVSSLDMGSVLTVQP
jgi:hypothetical protein